MKTEVDTKGRIPRERLRQAYAEILKGTSLMDIPRFGTIHVKHLSIWDTELLDIRRLEYLTKAEKEGLPSNEEKTKYLKKCFLKDSVVEDTYK